jgi:hypothetical protein
VSLLYCVSSVFCFRICFILLLCGPVFLTFCPFSKLNTENPSHHSNNAKKKGKNRNNNNLRPGGNNPQQNQPAGGNQNHGNHNPQRDNNNKCQGRNTNKILWKNFPCALCSEHGNYTHHCPQIFDFKWMKESMNAP